MRTGVRTGRTFRPAESHPDSHGAEAGLLLSANLRSAGASAGIHGDTYLIGGAGDWYSGSRPASVLFRRGRKELPPASDSRRGRPACVPHLWAARVPACILPMVSTY